MSASNSGLQVFSVSTSEDGDVADQLSPLTEHLSPGGSKESFARRSVDMQMKWQSNRRMSSINMAAALGMKHKENSNHAELKRRAYEVVDQLKLALENGEMGPSTVL